jgi:GT2 family glycosyltransferase
MDLSAAFAGANLSISEELRLVVVDLSICTVTFKARDLLKDCLNSILQNPLGMSFEIIVVDNHSEDGTLEMLEQEFPAVRVIKNTENAGYTRPMNQALHLAEGRYLVQLNNDTLIPPGTFDILADFMESHPEAGICTPKLLSRDGSLQKQCRRGEARPWEVISYFTGLAKLFPNSRFFGGYLQSWHAENETHQVKAVSGTCMFIRRAVIDQIGYLDERFFAYQEDTDFCVRAIRAGWKVYYLHTAQITHFGGMGGSRVQPYRSVFEWHRSYFYYYRKNLAQDYFFLFNWFYYLLMLIKLLFSLLVTLLRGGKNVGSKD